MAKKPLTLTAKFIAALKFDDPDPKKRSQIYWESNFPGGSFGVRVMRSGKKSFVFEYATPEGRKRMTIGDVEFKTLADARKKALDLAGKVANGEDPAQEKQDRDEAPTLSEFVKVFRTDRYKSKKLAESTIKNYDRRIDGDITKELGKKKLLDITRKDVVNLLDKIKERNAFTESNRVFEILRLIFNCAISRGLLEKNPCKGIEKATEESRDRALSDEELGRFWLACEAEDEPNRSMFKLLLLTGQRSREIRSLRWAYAKNGELFFPENKSKRPLHLPITPLIASILANLRKANAEQKERSRALDKSCFDIYLFPSRCSKGNSARTFRKELKSVCDRIEELVRINGEPPFRPHDLRRTLVTHILENGFATEGIVMRIINHKVDKTKILGVLPVYDRSKRMAKMKRALTAFGDRVLQLAEQQREEIQPFLEKRRVEKELRSKQNREARSKYFWKITSPEGEEHIVRALYAFCEAHGLCATYMQKLARGKCKSHRGWTCEKLALTKDLKLKATWTAVEQAEPAQELGQGTDDPEKAAA